MKMSSETEERNRMPPKDVARWKRMRYVMAVLVTMATSIAYSLRVTLSIAIVVMTHKDIDPQHPHFDWDSSTQGTVLSSFFWGCIVGNVPAAMLMQRFGIRWILLAGMALSTLGSFLTPLVSTAGDWQGLCVLRALEGVAQGPVFPAAFAILAKWTTPSERGRLASIAVSGMLIGSIVALPISGALADGEGGWPAIFYVFGGVGVAWCLLWLLLGYDSPQQHPFVSAQEKAFILAAQTNRPGPSQALSTPWKRILTSIPVWSIMISQCVHAWGFYMMLTEIPTYMNNILQYNIQSNGLLNALPHLTALLLIFVFGWLSDFLIRRNCLRVVNARKLFNTIGSCGPLLATIGLSYVGEREKAVAVGLLIASAGCNAGIFLGFEINHLDLSPNHASITMGMSNALSNVVSTFVPIVIGDIITDDKSEEQWHTVFWISAGLYLLGAIVFLFGASGDVQPWDQPVSPFILHKRNNNVETAGEPNSS